MTTAAWIALSVLVARLTILCARQPIGAALRWRVLALRRAVATHDATLLPLALGPTERAPPAAVVAWDAPDVECDDEDFAEVAVWCTASAAIELTSGASLDALRGARDVIETWEHDVAGETDRRLLLLPSRS